MNSRKFIKVSLLLLSLTLFVYYYLTHREQFITLSELSILQVSLILTGQIIIFTTNALILVVLVQFVRKKILFVDAIRITAYSSIINFFGFLQAGLGFRGVYLNRSLKIPYKEYFTLTLAQYFLVFGIAGLFVITGLGVLQDITLLVTLLAIVILLFLVFLSLETTKIEYIRGKIASLRQLSLVLQTKPLISLTVVVLLQLLGSFLAYSVELSSVGANISIEGLLVYTGISQFSIIVALTPGAIGIREGLLLIVKGRMGLDTQDIILASTIDRALYFVTLAFIAPLAIGAKKRLSKTKSETNF